MSFPPIDTEYLHRIDALSNRLQQEHGFTPVVAAEIEFYLFGAVPAKLDNLWDDLRARCAHASIPLEKTEAERGEGQFEIALTPVSARSAAEHAIYSKGIITECAQAHGMTASFAAKPLENQPGSGLHIHIHLEDGSGQNIYHKQDALMSDALRFSLGGLLATMLEHLPVFAPTSDSRARFIPGGNAPTTISWGANNRTTALRLPDSIASAKHIEHRVAGADADPAAVIAAILEGILHGLAHQSNPGTQIYGDASLEMYALPKLFAE